MRRAAARLERGLALAADITARLGPPWRAVLGAHAPRVTHRVVRQHGGARRRGRGGTLDVDDGLRRCMRRGGGAATATAWRAGRRARGEAIARGVSGAHEHGGRHVLCGGAEARGVHAMQLAQRLDEVFKAPVQPQHARLQPRRGVQWQDAAQRQSRPLGTWERRGPDAQHHMLQCTD
jgi:hypothetical protein